MVGRKELGELASRKVVARTAVAVHMAASIVLVVEAAACRNLVVVLPAHKVVTHKARHKAEQNATEEAARAGCNPAAQVVRIVR
jgi:hypothetical protein